MSGYALSAQAQAALEKIVSHTLGEFGSEQAIRVADAIFTAMDDLAVRPYMGHRREDLTPREVRFWTIRRLEITLVYQSHTEPLMFVHVLGPGQDGQRFFEA